jgi:hypothetical protein
MDHPNGPEADLDEEKDGRDPLVCTHVEEAQGSFLLTGAGLVEVLPRLDFVLGGRYALHYKIHCENIYINLEIIMKHLFIPGHQVGHREVPGSENIPDQRHGGCGPRPRVVGHFLVREK